MHCFNFVVVDKPIVYNVILETPQLQKMKFVASTYHHCVKFPTTRGIYTLCGDPLVARILFIVEKQSFDPLEGVEVVCENVWNHDRINLRLPNRKILS